MKTAKFDPGGGPIKVEIACKPNRDGSYRLTLYEASANDVVKKWPGNFLNPDDDEYAMPQPNAANDGRLLEGIVVVSVPPSVGPSTVSMTVRQDGKKLAAESQEVPPDSPGAVVDLFVQLEAK